MAPKLLKSASDLLKGSENTGKKRKRSFESSASSKLVEMQHEPVRCSWTSREVDLGKRVLGVYSGGEVFYNHRGDYWNPGIWMEFLARYNLLAGQESLPRLRAEDFLALGRHLHSMYCRDIKAAQSYGYTDMENVFSPCRDCQLRIPVFPVNLLGQSNNQGHSNSYSNSGSGRRRSYTEAFGNDNHSSIGVRQNLNNEAVRANLIATKLNDMWLKDHLSDQNLCVLLSKRELLEALWFSFIMLDNAAIDQKARVLITAFCGGVSTSRH